MAVGGFGPAQRGDVYGNTGDANVYVYVWFIDSSHTVLEPGQVIANFVTTKKGSRPDLRI